MKRFALQISMLLLLCAGGMSLRAETVTHSFNLMNGNGRITFTNSNTVGTTEFVTYTCSDCDFGGDPSSKVSIRFLEKYDSVVISPALNNVKSLYLLCTSSVEPKDILRVYVSEDGSTWSNALTGATTPMAGAMQIAIPEGYYYLKIASISNRDIYILSIAYEFDNCPSCFTYEF